MTCLSRAIVEKDHDRIVCICDLGCLEERRSFKANIVAMAFEAQCCFVTFGAWDVRRAGEQRPHCCSHAGGHILASGRRTYGFIRLGNVQGGREVFQAG